MLFKLSLSNIRKSLRDYAIYFFTLIIGVSVFYVFNAIGGQSAMLELSESRAEIVKLLTTVLSAVSVFVAGVLGLLIVYASRFLMKRRSREFALYMMLGMSKGKISAILFLETMIIGIGSLGVGLVVGIGFSQITSALVANLFEADMTAYRFTVSGEAAVKTIFYFALMYLVVMLFNGIVCTRMKLIDLIQSGKKAEQIKLKKPVLCVLVFLLAAAALGYAYYSVTWKFNDLSNEKLLLSIILGVVSTFFIFWSVSGMLLRVVMSMKSLYHRSLNCFTFRQISSKVNTMVFSMSVICLMLFVTICTLSAAFSVRNSMNANLKELCPADFDFERSFEDGTIRKDLIRQYLENGYDLTEDFSRYTHFYTYADSAFTFADSLEAHLDEIKKRFRYLEYDTPEEFVRLSDYNALMALYGKKKLVLEDDEFILLCNYQSMKDVRDEALGADTKITVFGQTLRSKYTDCQEGFITISVEKLNAGLYVVPDAVIDGAAEGMISVNTEYFIGNYFQENKEEAERTVRSKLDQVLRLISDAEDGESYAQTIMRTSRIELNDAAIGLGAIVTFLGLYIGLVFLIASGAILALKELSESVDSIGRYEMLRKLGADESDIAKSLFRQTGIFFLLPLLLACIHSVFGMRFAVRILEIFGTENIFESVAFTSLFLLLIYGGYFLITFFCSKGIIKERK